MATRVATSAGVRPARALPVVSAHFRRQRSIRLRHLIRGLAEEKGRLLRILDLGGTPHYWNQIGAGFLSEVDASVTCVNSNPAELHHENVPGRIDVVLGDARAVEAEDDSFDLVHSNSVIEHVGRISDLERFAGEVVRLAPCYYVQTPNYWFPVDPHYYRFPALHWLPTPVQASLLRRFRLGSAPAAGDLATAMRQVESRYMLTPKLFRLLFPDAEHTKERVLGMTKSLIAVRRKRLQG